MISDPKGNALWVPEVKFLVPREKWPPLLPRGSDIFVFPAVFIHTLEFNCVLFSFGYCSLRHRYLGGAPALKFEPFWRLCCAWIVCAWIIAHRAQQFRMSQGRCSTCNTFLHKWNGHGMCITCQVKTDQACDPTSPCHVCHSWEDSTWSLYIAAVKEAKTKLTTPRARRSLSYPPPLPNPFWTQPHGFSPGVTGYPYGLPASQPVYPGWNPEAYRDYLSRQLEALDSAPYLSDRALEQGIRDADELTCGQRSRASRSVSSDWSDILTIPE